MKTVSWTILGIFLMSIMGCSYAENYRAYADAQARMSLYNGPLVELYEDGRVKSIGNPMNALAQIQMKSPSSEADSFFHFLSGAVPFLALWGVVGSMANATHGNTTNVNGANNYTGNTATGSPSNWGSPPTTNTINNFLPNEVIVE